jgi:uncharacterized protein
MTQAQIIRKTTAYVKNIQQGEGSGHDWWHTFRVWQLAKHIGQRETADLFIVQLAALLHDIADWKFHQGDESIGPQKAAAWLKQMSVDSTTTNQVTRIIKALSFKGARVKEVTMSLEGQIVQDADRLDAIGAIGIARCFTYGGFTRRPIYHPDQKPQLHQTATSYKNNHSPSINHFFEKLLLVKDRMHTKTAKQIARSRHDFMHQYLDRFFQEINQAL